MWQHTLKQLLSWKMEYRLEPSGTQEEQWKRMMVLLKAKEYSLYHISTPPGFSGFWHNLCFADLKNVPCVLADAVPTLSRAGDSHPLVSIPRHAHPPTGARGEGRTESPSFGTAVRAASHTPLVKRQTRHLSSRCGNSLWRPSRVRAQLARGLPAHPAPTTPAALPSWALLQPGGTGTHWHGRDGGHDTQGQKAAWKEWRSEQQHPRHNITPLLRKPLPQKATGWAPSPSMVRKASWVHQKSPGQAARASVLAAGLRNGDLAKQLPTAALF